MSAKKLNATGTYATACGIFRAAPTTLECLQCNAAIEESFGNRAQLDPGSSERPANLIALHGLVVPTHDQRIGVMLDLVHPLGLRRTHPDMGSNGTATAPAAKVAPSR